MSDQQDTPGEHQNKSNNAVTKGRRESKWYDLSKLVIGFILTGVVGTVISQFYKEREVRAEQQRKEIEAAINVFYDVSETFSKRHFYSLRANSAVEQWSTDSDDRWRREEGIPLVKEAFHLYDESVTEWNLRRFRLKAIIDVNFGPSFREEIDKIGSIMGDVRDDLVNLRDQALDDNKYDKDLHVRIYKRIENEEEPAINAFRDKLEESLRERQRPPDGFVSLVFKGLGLTGSHNPNDSKMSKPAEKNTTSSK
jgi:hypothetical protein